jgi:hypothetical protein
LKAANTCKGQTSSLKSVVSVMKLFVSSSA